MLCGLNKTKSVDQIQPYSLVRVHYPKGWIKPTWPEGSRQGLPEEGAPRQRCGGRIPGSTLRTARRLEHREAEAGYTRTRRAYALLT